MWGLPFDLSKGLRKSLKLSPVGSSVYPPRLGTRSVHLWPPQLPVWALGAPGYPSRTGVVLAPLSFDRFSTLNSDGHQDHRITWPDSHILPPQENFRSVCLHLGNATSIPLDTEAHT